MSTSAQQVLAGKADSGWYVFVGCLLGFATANNKIIGPWVTGILGIALIYQLGKTLQKKG
jgi:hypothetical protein